MVLVIAFVMSVLSVMAWTSPCFSAGSASSSVSSSASGPDLMLDPPLRPGSIFNQSRREASTKYRPGWPGPGV
jgi:hypothetical protein